MRLDDRYPTIDQVKTGKKIKELREQKGLSVRELQRYFLFEDPSVIYKWQKGECLPNLDNFVALSALMGVSVNDIVVLEDGANSCNKFGIYKHDKK